MDTSLFERALDEQKTTLIPKQACPFLRIVRVSRNDTHYGKTENPNAASRC
jgi:hypothetical protein